MKTVYKVIIFIAILLVLIYYFNNKTEYLENNAVCTNSEECDSKFCAYIHPITKKGICKVEVNGSCDKNKNECFRSNCVDNKCTV
jgi:hypothetical protein